MNPPDDPSLPFFAYGLFRPGALGFKLLRIHVSSVDPHREVKGELRIRDGIPVLFEGDERVMGDIIRFKEIESLAAYEAIAGIEPDEIYKWNTIDVSGQRANVLLARRPGLRDGSEREGDVASGDLLLPVLIETANELISEARAIGPGLGNRSGYVYILASKRNGTLYIGVTSDIPARMLAHREGRGSAFVKKYGVFMLVWYEEHPLYASAIRRETSLKRWQRAWKIALIEKTNPDWDDLLLKWNE